MQIYRNISLGQVKLSIDVMAHLSNRYHSNMRPGFTDYDTHPLVTVLPILLPLGHLFCILPQSHDHTKFLKKKELKQNSKCNLVVVIFAVIVVL